MALILKQISTTTNEKGEAVESPTISRETIHIRKVFKEAHNSYRVETKGMFVNSGPETTVDNITRRTHTYITFEAIDIQNEEVTIARNGNATLSNSYLITMSRFPESS